MKSALYTLLTNDATLMAILTGGLEYQVVEITRQGSPNCFDTSGEIKPCALLKLNTDVPFGEHYQSSRLTFNLYWYQLNGYDQIDLARARARTLLHRQKITPTTGTCWEIHHDNDVLDQEDQALRCAMSMSRYAAYIGR